MRTNNVVVKWAKLNQWAARNLDCAMLHNPDEPVEVRLTERKVESVFKAGEDLLQIEWRNQSVFVPEYYVTDVDALAKRLMQESLLVSDGLVSAMLSNGTFQIDDVENLYGRKDESDLKDEYPDEWHVWNTAQNPPSNFVEYLINVHNAEISENDDSDNLESEFPDEWETWGKIDNLDTSDYASFADYLIEDCDIDESDLEDTDSEIYEWWQVDSWLERHLKEHGEAFLENEFGTWWGRRTTGQAVYMDSVIQDIARDVANA